MNRKILCKPCYDKLKEIAGRYNEPIVGVEGRAITVYHCDDCNLTIEDGGQCVATSIFQEGQDPKTGAWEYEYVIPNVPHRNKQIKFVPQTI